MTEDLVDGSSSTKKMNTALKIGTHSGGFHCDELLACFMLTRLPQYRDAHIVRYWASTLMLMGLILCK